MKAKIYMRYDYVGDSEVCDISEEEYIRMLDKEYGGTFGDTNGVGRPTVHVGSDGVKEDEKWAPCEAELFNDMMKSMTVDEMITHCVQGGQVTFVIRPDIEKMDPFFEEEYHTWVNESESSRKASVEQPKADIAISFRNLAGDTVWVMADCCSIFGLVNNGCDTIVTSTGMGLIDEITNIHKDTDG